MEKPFSPEEPLSSLIPTGFILRVGLFPISNAAVAFIPGRRAPSAPSAGRGFTRQPTSMVGVTSPRKASADVPCHPPAEETWQNPLRVPISLSSSGPRSIDAAPSCPLCPKLLREDTGLPRREKWGSTFHPEMGQKRHQKSSPAFLSTRHMQTPRGLISVFPEPGKHKALRVYF